MSAPPGPARIAKRITFSPAAAPDLTLTAEVVGTASAPLWASSPRLALRLDGQGLAVGEALIHLAPEIRMEAAKVDSDNVEIAVLPRTADMYLIRVLLQSEPANVGAATLHVRGRSGHDAAVHELAVRIN